MSDVRLGTAVRERWLSVLLATLAGLVLAAVVSLLVPRQYESQVLVYISSQGAQDNTTQAYQGSLLSEQRVTSYVSLIASARMAQDVTAQLGGTVPEDVVANALSASAETDSVIITIDARATSPEESAAIANAAGIVFPRLVAEVEQPLDGRPVPSVGARVVQAATVPTDPVSPNLPLNLASGLVLGLLAGLVIAVTRSALDTSVKSAEQLARLTGRPGLGEIAHRDDVERNPLIMMSDPRAPSAEAFREIRTNLQFAQVEGDGSAFCVTSAVPAEGKSTFTANLAIALASLGVRVLLLECDLRRPKVSDYFGLDRTVGVTSVLLGRVSLDEAVQRWGNSGLSVIGSGPIPHNPSELLASDRMRQLIDEAKGRYDLLLFDTPPLLPVTDAAMLATQCDGVVLVTRYGRTSTTQVRSAVAALEAVSARVIGTVLSLVPAKQGKRGYEYAYYGTTGPVVEDEERPGTTPESDRYWGRYPDGLGPAPVEPSPGRRPSPHARQGEHSSAGTRA